MHRSYRELRAYSTLEERFNYLSLRGVVGNQTFGFDRWINQTFYRSREWKQVRHEVIVRDNGCDLGVEGYDIHDRVIIHHMNPMTPEEIEQGSESILNPAFLISTTLQTHNAIHYGDASLLPRVRIDRAAGDTKLW